MTIVSNKLHFLNDIKIHKILVTIIEWLFQSFYPEALKKRTFSPSKFLVNTQKKASGTGNRTRASWVKARYPSH